MLVRNAAQTAWILDYLFLILHLQMSSTVLRSSLLGEWKEQGAATACCERDLPHLMQPFYSLIDEVVDCEETCAMCFAKSSLNSYLIGLPGEQSVVVEFWNL